MSNRILVAIPVVFLVSGCFGMLGMKRTPLPDAQISQLTTCKTGDLAKIKKNLVLAGYSVQRADGDLLETEYKQTDRLGDSKSFEKISVVRVDETTAKFKVKVRVDRREKVQTGEVKDSMGRTVATGSTMEKTSDEDDTQYYEEARPQYEATRKMVCGD